MKNAKRLASLLLAVAMMFTLVFANGNIFSAFAETTTIEKALVMLDFESGDLSGWEANEAAQRDTTANQRWQTANSSVLGGNALEVRRGDGPNWLYEYPIGTAVNKASLEYKFSITQMSNPAYSDQDIYLPTLLYAGAPDEALNENSAPLGLYIESMDLYYNYGRGIGKGKQVIVDQLEYETAYTLRVEYDLPNDSVKVYLNGSELALPTTDLEVGFDNTYIDHEAKLDRISVGVYNALNSHAFIDDLKVTTEVPVEEETLVNMNFTVEEGEDPATVLAGLGWTDNTAAPKPDSEETQWIIENSVESGLSSNALKVTNKLNQHWYKELNIGKAVDNAVLEYNFSFVQISPSLTDQRVYLPTLMYEGATPNAENLDAAPLGLYVRDGGILYYNYGRAIAGYGVSSTGKTLEFGKSYTVRIEYNLPTKSVKVFLRDNTVANAQLEQLDLSATPEAGYGSGSIDAAGKLDRITVGAGLSGGAMPTRFYVDDIKVTTLSVVEPETPTPSEDPSEDPSEEPSEEPTEAPEPSEPQPSEPATNGYQANLNVANTATVGEDIAVNVVVNHSSETVFAAGEFKVTYDASKVSFVSVNNATTGSTAGIKVKAQNGVITVEDFGNDKNLPATYTLNFTASAEGDATFTLSGAAFSAKEDAIDEDLEAIVNTPAAATVTVEPATFSVTLPENVTGNSDVVPGGTYTFTVADYDKYDYTITATMGGVAATVVPGENGSYSIADVTGDLVITATRTPKVFNVTIDGETADNDGTTATYGVDYSFTLPENIAAGSEAGTNYAVESITIGGVAYTGFSSADRVYTIPGTDILGDIEITISATTVAPNEFAVSVVGNGAGIATGYATKGTIGQNYVLTVSPLAGYNYTVSVTMGGVAAQYSQVGNTYTVAAVSGHLVFTITATAKTDNVSVHEYVTLQGTNMWLVLQAEDLGANSYATYNGQAMFYSDKYEAYAYLVTAETLTEDDAKALIGVASGSATEIAYSYNVNGSAKIDANDAQLVHNIYNTIGIDEVSTNQFFLADVNGDKQVNIADAVAVVTYVLEQ